MQIFPKRVVEILKKWAPPRHVTFKCPPGVQMNELFFTAVLASHTVVHQSLKNILIIKITLIVLYKLISQGGGGGCMLTIKNFFILIPCQISPKNIRQTGKSKS